MINILKPKEEYVIEYPEAIVFAEEQSDIMWTAKEVSVEKDIHDLKTNFTESEYHGIVYLLKLFNKYEVRVGGDYWKEYIGTIFKRPEFERLASTFSYMELGVHAPFYNRINELLGLDTDAFYQDYLNDPILSNRMKWLAKRVTKKETHFDILKSIGIFSMIEGAILFSSFAFIKHFNSNGKNKLSNINAGINFSANDENIHSKAGAWMFRTMLQEVLASNQSFIKTHLRDELYETADTIREHEFAIINNIFEKGHIEGIAPTQLINFVESRLDICLVNLGYEARFKPSYNPIAKWFYNDLNSSTLHDFFVTQGNDYNRNWDSRRFVW